MIGFLRLPDLNSASCLTRYSGCWPCRIGCAGLPREPSALWQAAQTCVAIARPWRGRPWRPARRLVGGRAPRRQRQGERSDPARTARRRRRGRKTARQRAVGRRHVVRSFEVQNRRFYNQGFGRRDDRRARPSARAAAGCRGHGGGSTMRAQGRAGLDAYRALPHHRQPARPAAGHRAARDRLRRPLQRRQVDRHQHAGPAPPAGLRLEDAGPHAARQPVRARPARRRRRAVRRPAGLRLCGGRARRQAALAAGDGRLPRAAPQPERAWC